MAKKNLSNEANTIEIVKEKLTCGIVMPISSIDNCSAEHWKEVQEILKDAISSAGFIARLVSESEDSGIIQKRIIQNLYSDVIVVCDVSGKNPNVMFELGMRLAFDKPTIIVKDDKTDYSFDTSPIEHVPYPRDLRFASVVKFKEQLTDKVKATYKRASEDRNYTTFLKHFGKFKIAELDEQVIGKEDYILKSIEELRDEVRRIPSKTRIIREHQFEGANDRVGIIRDKLKDYLKLTDKTLKDIAKGENNLIEDLTNYLEQFEDVRDSCGNRQTLEKTIALIV